MKGRTGQQIQNSKCMNFRGQDPDAKYSEQINLLSCMSEIVVDWLQFREFAADFQAPSFHACHVLWSCGDVSSFRSMWCSFRQCHVARLCGMRGVSCWVCLGCAPLRAPSVCASGVSCTVCPCAVCPCVVCPCAACQVMNSNLYGALSMSVRRSPRLASKGWLRRITPKGGFEGRLRRAAWKGGSEGRLQKVSLKGVYIKERGIG